MDTDILDVYARSFRDNHDLPALTDYGESGTLSYLQLAERIAQIHIFFEKAGIRPGDKVALIGKNSARWVTIFMASITYGAVIVPILPDFTPEDAQHIVNHSDARLLFVQRNIWEAMDVARMPMLIGVMSLDRREVLSQLDNGVDLNKIIRGIPRSMKRRYPAGFSQVDIVYEKEPSDTVAVINYTSGTTGFSKGVMLSLGNLSGNVSYGISVDLYRPGSRCLSFLPLSHAYGCAFDMLVPLACGAHVTLFNKIPSPHLLMKAMADVRPNLVVCVPLVLEKIYRKQIVPMISRPPLSWALAVPMIDKAIYGQIRRKLVEAFGGEFSQVIVGGAPLNPEVEDFLYKIKFPFSVGYGMTECGPLISYDHNYEYVPGSCGQVLKGIMEVRIDSDDPYNKVGEIQVRGENVMKGYYKNEEATKNAFTEDGWLHTGDLGTIDADNRIFIRGRSKTMILGASGQNIYPEEIESKINNLPFVMESIVIEKNGKLVALVYPDYDTVDGTGISHTDLPVIMEQNRVELNKQLASYEVVSEIQLYPTKFEKTPKKSIKRYLYSNY